MKTENARSKPVSVKTEIAKRKRAARALAPPDPDSEWANKIRGVLLRMNMTNVELGRLAGLGHATIYRFLNGIEVRCDTFQRLAKFCGYEMVLKRDLQSDQQGESMK